MINERKSNGYVNNFGGDSTVRVDDMTQQLRDELRRVSSQLDETRSELSKFQINYSILEAQLKQTNENQQLEIEKLKKKVHFLMEKRFLDYMKANGSNQQQQNSRRSNGSARDSNSDEDEEEYMASAVKVIDQMVDDELVITF